MRKLCGKVMEKCFGEWGRKKETIDWKQGRKRLQCDENRGARGRKYRQTAGVGRALKMGMASQNRIPNLYQTQTKPATKPEDKPGSKPKSKPEKQPKNPV